MLSSTIDSFSHEGFTRLNSEAMVLGTSGPLEGVGARLSENYTLTHLGADKVPGGGDDTIVPLVADYQDGATQISLRPASGLSTGWDESDYLMDLGLMGDWVVSPDGTTVRQQAEAGASFFVSEATWSWDRFAGRISIDAEATDDDAIGLAFAFEEEANGEPFTYYLLSWRAAAQEGAEAGLTLAKVTGDGTTDPDLWTLDEADADVEIVATDAAVLWQPGGEYDFAVLRDSATGAFTVTISHPNDGTELVTLASADDALPDGLGRVGFYCHSQGGVTFAAERDARTWDDGFYILRVHESLTDLDGYSLDGDGDGQPGGDYVTHFTIDTVPPVVPGANYGANEIYVTLDDFGGMDPASVADPANWTLAAADGDDTFGEGSETDVSHLIQSVVWETDIAVATLSLVDVPDETDLYELRIGQVTDLAGNVADPPSEPLRFRGEDLLADTVVWKPVTGGNWNDPANWSGGTLPGENDRVVISQTGIEISVPVDVTVRRVHSAADLQINAGTFTVLGNSEVTGALTVANGAALKADGDGAVLVASGPTTIGGASLYAVNRGQLVLNAATQYTHTSTANHQDRVIEASGAGSLISMTGLTEVNGGTHYDCDVTIRTLDGGRIDVPNVTTIDVPAAGDQRRRGVHIAVDGVNSVIDLSGLQRFDDHYGWTDSSNHDGQMSQLKAVNGGHVELGALTQLQRVDVSQIDGTGTMDLSTVQSAHVARFNISTDMTFPSLSRMDHAYVYVSGADVQFPAATNIDSVATLEVSNGGRLSIPSATTNNPIWSTDQTWTATGTGSVLSLPGLEEVLCGTNYDNDVTIQALAGGRVELPNVVRMENPNEGDQRRRGIHVTADGEGSSIDLGSLETFDDHYGWTDSSNHDGQMSQLKAIHGGQVDLGSLTHLQRVDLPQIDGTGTMDLSTVEWAHVARLNISTDMTFPNLWRMDHAYVYVSGADVEFPAATNIDSVATLEVSSGGRLSIPSATTNNPIWSVDQTWTATGTDSVLSLPGLEEVLCGTNYDNDVTIQALAGGRVELPNVIRIEDPSEGDQRRRGIHVTADGEGSSIDLGSLERFEDFYGWTDSTNHDGQMSQLRALDGSQIMFGAEQVAVENVEVFTSGLLTGSLRLSGNSTLGGSGQVGGSVSAAGASVVRPGGTGIGNLEVVGDYTQSSGATLDIQLGGAEAGTYDQLIVGGLATLDGHVATALTGGFFPADEDEFTIVTATAREGVFSSYSGYDLGNGTQLSPVYGLGTAGFAVEFSTGPFVEDCQPSGTVVNELASLVVTFSEVVAEETLTEADVQLEGPAGAIGTTSVSPAGDRSFRIVFPRQTLHGDYTLMLGPDVTDAVGNPMNQDGDGVNGEPYVDTEDPGDVFVHVVSLDDQAAPVVTNIDPVGRLNQPVSAITIALNEDVTFDSSNVAITTPTGAVPAGDIDVTPVDGRTFAVTLPEQTRDGQYRVEIGGVGDVRGNVMTTTYATIFEIDQTGPRVLSMVPTGDVHEVVDAIMLTFSDDVDASTVAQDDVSLLDPDSGSVPLNLEYQSDSVFRVSFNGHCTLGDLRAAQW